MGKSAFALNIAEHVAFNENLPVVLFCLASQASSLNMQLASSISGISLRNIASNNLSEFDFHCLNSSISRIQESKLHIEGTLRLSVTELSDRVLRLSDQHGKPGLIVVDDLSHTFVSKNRGKAFADELRGLSHELKMLAQAQGCPVIVPTPLGRAMERRRDKRPRLTDLRSGGSLEQEADTIMMLYRADYYCHDASPKPCVAEITLVKHSSNGCVKLVFCKETRKFQNVTTTYQEPA